MRESKLRRLLLQTLLPLSTLNHRSTVDAIKKHIDTKIAELRENTKPANATWQPRGKNGGFVSTKENNTSMAVSAEKPAVVTSAETQKVVTSYIDEKGRKFVHICAGDIDCHLAINDLSDKDMTKDDAKKLAEDNGMRLPKKREWSLIGAFIEEVNSLIKELGGSPLTDWYAAEENADYNADRSWYFNGTYGCINLNSRSYARYSLFRCRPVLASPNPSLKS